MRPNKIAGRRRKALRRGLFKLFAWLIIGFALLIALLKLALPWIAQHPAWIAERLSHALGVPVALAGAQSHLNRQLELELHELKIGEALSINRAYAALDPLGFMPGRSWLKSLRVENLSLQLLQTDRGWQLSGFGETKPYAFPDWRALVKRVGQISLSNSELNLRAQDGKTLRFNKVAAALTRDASTYKLGLKLVLAEKPNLDKFSPEFSQSLRQLVPATNFGELEGVLHWRDSPTQPINSYLKLNTLQTEGFAHWLPEPARALHGALSGELWLNAAHANGRFHTQMATFKLMATPIQPQDGAELPKRQPIVVHGQSSDGENYAGLLRFGTSQRALQAAGEALKSSARASVEKLSQPDKNAAPRLNSDAGWALRWPDSPSARAVLELERIDVAQLAGALQGFLAFAAANSLAQADPSGEIALFRLLLDRGAILLDQRDAAPPTPRWQAQLKTRSLSLKPSDWGERPQLPGFSGLDLELVGNTDSFSISAQAAPLRFSEPKRFKRELQSALFSTSGAFWRESGGWQLDLPNIQLDDPDFKAQIGVNISAAGDRFDWPEDSPNRAPQLAFNLALARGNVARARDFWDQQRLSPKLISWLESALQSGKVASGYALLRAPLKPKQFPFAEQQGIFETRFKLEATTLKFASDWPAAVLQGDVSMRNGQLFAPALSGSIAENKISHARVEIADFREPWLDLSVQGSSNADALLSLIRQTPIGSRYGENFAELSMLGPTRTDLAFKLPLRPELGEKSLLGKTQLDGVALNNSAWRLALSDLHGELGFDIEGFSSNTLHGTNLLEKMGADLAPISMTAAVGESHTGSANQLVRVTLEGPMSAQTLFGDIAVLKPVIAASTGTALWQIVSLTERRGEKIASTIELQSDLKGIALDLPVPLGKTAASTRMLVARVPIEAESRRTLLLQVADNVRFQAKLASRSLPFQGELRLGSGALQAPLALPLSGLALRGSLREPNWQAWGSIGAAFFTATPVAGAEPLLDSSTTGLYLRDVDLALLESAQSGSASRLQLQPAADGWTATIASEKVSGTLRYRSEVGAIAQLEAQFERLFLDEPDSPAASRRAVRLDAAVAGKLGASAGSSSASPALLPALHVYIKDFAFGQARLGETRLETFPVEGGLRVDLLSSKSELLALNATGTWLAQGFGSQSHFNMRFTAEDLGKMLTGLGFAGHVGGGQTSVQIDANWNGPPQSFSWQSLQGTMKIWVGSGRFLEISPGAGRIFGLLSLQELPRRLALDFRDFFQSGMSFNEIAGTFLFNGGNAYTQDLRIKSPAADIIITGRTGMAARDYEQTAKVRPKVGILPIVGAVAAGPAGVAAGLLAQNVLERENAFAVSYQIAGSWEKPEVKKLKPSDTIRDEN